MVPLQYSKCIWAETMLTVVKFCKDWAVCSRSPGPFQSLQLSSLSFMAFWFWMAPFITALPNNTQWEIFQKELSVGPWTSIKPVQTAVKKLTHEEKRWNASWIKVKSELVIQRRLSDANGYRKRWEEQVECSQVEEKQGLSRPTDLSSSKTLRVDAASVRHNMMWQN